VSLAVQNGISENIGLITTTTTIIIIIVVVVVAAAAAAAANSVSVAEKKINEKLPCFGVLHSAVLFYLIFFGKSQFAILKVYSQISADLWHTPVAIHIIC
jgi:hypothetical protein